MGAPVGNKNAAGPHNKGKKSAMRAATLRNERPSSWNELTRAGDNDYWQNKFYKARDQKKLPDEV